MQTTLPAGFNDAWGAREFAWPGALAVLLWPWLTLAQAPNSPCVAARVRIEGALQDRWLGPVAKMCEALATLRDADPSASLLIVPEGDALRIEALLGDGRIAQRRVGEPDELLVTAFALMLVPAQSARSGKDADSAGGFSAAPQPSASFSAPGPLSPEPASPQSAAPAAPLSPATSAPPAAGLPVEISVSLAGHLARAPSYLSLGLNAHAGIRPGAWLLGLGLRWEPGQTLMGDGPPGFEMDSVGVGFLIARRVLGSSKVQLETGVSTFLLVETQSYRPDAVELTDTDADVRLGLLLRMLVGSGAWRLSPSVDADLSPLRLRTDQRSDPGLPTLPSWSIGVGIGVVWGEL